MSQMHQWAAGSTCPNPNCKEPVESGDRFCGGCGHDLSASRPTGPDRPTLPVHGTLGERPDPHRVAVDPEQPPGSTATGPERSPGGVSSDGPPDAGHSGARHTVDTADGTDGAASAAGAAAQPGPSATGPAQLGSPDGTPAATVEWPVAGADGAVQPPPSAQPPHPAAPGPAPQAPPAHPTEPPRHTPPQHTPPPPQAQPTRQALPGQRGGAETAPASPHPQSAHQPPPTGHSRQEAQASQVPQSPQTPQALQQTEQPRQPQPAGHPAEPAPSPQPPAFQAPAPRAPADPAPPGAPVAPAPLDPPDSDYRLAAPQPPAGQPMRDDTPPGPPQHQPYGTTDPRTVEPAALPAPAAEAKLCVFCGTGHVDRDDYCGHCGKAQPRERDHMEQELDAVAAVSDRGLRHHRNEDAFAVTSTALQDGAPAVVAVVCDGVSSASRPDDASMAASRAATEALLEALPRGTHPQQAMHEAILAAAEAVNALAHDPATAQESGQNENAPACTLVGAVVVKDLLIVGWVGDSRAYWVPVDRSVPAARLTEDDSWAAQMVASGLMNEAEAYADERAHAITGWLGADAYELLPHTAAFKPDRPGVVVVCTDGLWNYAESAADMAAVLPEDAAQRPLNSAQVLVGHALEGGGHDNVTVAVLPFPAPPPGAGSA